MCGITGWIDRETDLTQKHPILTAMAETMSCRGPDATGTWLSTSAALGHRRLIVVDPEGGGQPMFRQYGERTYVITYNGELYNTPELRQELERLGHTFKGHSDTEVLLVAFIEWGPSCVERLNGIFAFGVWNDADQSLFLTRDRLGVKPLFYTQRGSSFIFGSEIKALLAHPAVKPEITAEGLAEIFVMGPARTPGHGIFNGITEILPGQYLIYNQNGLHLHRYWSLESRPHLDNLDTTVVRVRELLRDAVKRQLVADVPVCTLLSGGLDSSALTAFAAEEYKLANLGPVDTYSLDYVDNDHYFRPNEFQPNSDAPWVKLVSDFLGTHHKEITIDTAQLVDALETAMQARDLPGMADVDTSLYLFCREIKKEATVGLSGECSDEVFGGYPWFFKKNTPTLADTFPWSRNLLERMRFLSPDLIKQIRPSEYMAERYQEALQEVPRLPGEDPLEAQMREMFYLNITRWMPTLLDRKDRMSMATGLEVRVPFCDHHLVEYVWNIPWAMKNCDQMEKGILRRALSGMLPDDVLTRRKSPFPKTHNPDYLAAMRQWVIRILDDSNSPLLPLIDRTAIYNFVQSDQVNTNLPWFGQLMNVPQLLAYLIQVNIWMRKYRVTIC